jgi:leader peptidase (prepilin peptidase) / N-methyltransferase
MEAASLREMPLLLAAAGLFGLCVGSFLNVVIYRLPKILERQWHADARAALEMEPAAEQPFNLVTPASTCRQCGHRIRWFENIPLFSYAWLRGKCSSCGTPIGLRYPFVELCNGALWLVIAYLHGITPLAFGYMLLATVLLALFWIDWDTQLLPDDLTLPLVWAGLLFQLITQSVPLSSAVIGAAAGYLVLWSIFHAFRLLTGKEGMGYGDFKLFAALGAWFGWTALVPMLLASSLAGAIIGGGLMATGKLSRGQPFAFGPFLALVGLVAICVPPQRWLGAVMP